jgi:excisionase family DNA binding protein
MELNNNNNEDATRLLYVPEAAAILRLSPRTVWRMIAEGELKAVHYHRTTFVYRRDVLEYIKRNERVESV